MSTETIIIISAVVEIVLLFAFFVLIDNVIDIKKRITGVGENQNAKFSFYLSIGDKENAKSILKQIILSESSFKIAFYSNLPYKESERKKLHDKYGKMMELVDMKFDFDIVEKIIKKDA